MGKIISGYIFPHPPVIVPEIGKGEETGARNTISAVEKAARHIKEDQPDTIIVTTPHGPVFQDYIFISLSGVLAGDFGRFGNSRVRLEFRNDTSLAESIIDNARYEGIYAGDVDGDTSRKYRIHRELDHGALVPLYFVNREFKDFKLVHISIAGIPFEDLYRFGMCISKAVEETDKNVVFLASGDLSHRLSKNAPYGFSADGPKFDKFLVESIKNGDIHKLFELDESFCESAGECGLRSFLMMFGAFEGYDLKPEVFSYEGPFGVGYSVARFEPAGKNPEREILKKVEDRNIRRVEELRSNEDPYVALARKALETYVREGKILKVSGGLPDEMLEKRAGTFVSLKKGGRLRGCIGTTGPTRRNIAEEIISNAISAGTRDPRFDPVEPEELDKIAYSVDILKEAEPVNSIEELDVIKYGVIVRSGMRSGLLLPNLEGVDTPEKQVSIALQKAGISPNEKYSMERFEVVRHK